MGDVSIALRLHLLQDGDGRVVTKQRGQSECQELGEQILACTYMYSCIYVCIRGVLCMFIAVVYISRGLNVSCWLCVCVWAVYAGWFHALT